LTITSRNPTPSTTTRRNCYRQPVCASVCSKRAQRWKRGLATSLTRGLTRRHDIDARDLRSQKKVKVTRRTPREQGQRPSVGRLSTILACSAIPCPTNGRELTY
jgi:hypothetical protein